MSNAVRRCECYGCQWAGQGTCGCFDCRDCGAHFDEPLTADEDGYRCDVCLAGGTDAVIADALGAEVAS